MRGSLTAAALTLAIVPAFAHAQSHESAQTDRAKNQRPITLQGCVVAGVDKGTAALTSVGEIAEAGRSAMPPEAHGRHVVFWLSPDDAIVSHIGEMVEVRGVTTKIEKSEIELKAGHQKGGGLVAEFEGPGKDVKVPNAVVGDAVGTAGRTKAEKDDVKTFLVRVKVEDVKRLEGSCR